MRVTLSATVFYPNCYESLTVATCASLQCVYICIFLRHFIVSLTCRWKWWTTNCLPSARRAVSCRPEARALSHLHTVISCLGQTGCLCYSSCPEAARLWYASPYSQYYSLVAYCWQKLCALIALPSGACDIFCVCKDHSDFTSGEIQPTRIHPSIQIIGLKKFPV